MAIRNVRLENDEILRKKSRTVEVIDDKIKELVKASDVWGTFEQGEKLKNMLLSCRVKDKLDENTRLLFDMGYQG